jgi:hypothetical protein
MDSTPSPMASFRLMHRQTGAVLPGYRVLSATEIEIHEANHRLRTAGSPMRFVIDLHPAGGSASGGSASGGSASGGVQPSAPALAEVLQGEAAVCDARETAHPEPVLISSNPA